MKPPPEDGGETPTASVGQVESGAEARRVARPAVSVVVPVRSGADTISACLDALLGQDYPEDRREILVVDDGSSDATRDLVRARGVPCLGDGERRGAYGARNLGIRAARGEIIAFTDADCVPSPSWLTRGVDGFAGPQAGCVAGSVRGLPPATVVQAYQNARGALSERLSLGHPFLPYPQTCNAFYARVVLDRIGLFEETWVSGGDADLAWRMQLETSWRIRLAPAALVLHRHRPTLAGLFGQRVRWGIGRVLLYQKYRELMSRRGAAATLRDYGRPAWFALKAALPCAGRDAAGGLRYAMLDCVSELGIRVGTLVGSLRTGVRY